MRLVRVSVFPDPAPAWIARELSSGAVTASSCLAVRPEREREREREDRRLFEG
jgi:hypothetical protein